MGNVVSDHEAWASRERYNGWTNRETWAVALHINNDQGWQESVHEALRTGNVQPPEEAEGTPWPPMPAWQAGEIVRENVEAMLDSDSDLWSGALPEYIDNVLPV